MYGFLPLTSTKKHTGIGNNCTPWNAVSNWSPSSQRAANPRISRAQPESHSSTSSPGRASPGAAGGPNECATWRRSIAFPLQLSANRSANSRDGGKSRSAPICSGTNSSFSLRTCVATGFRRPGRSARAASALRRVRRRR